MQVLNGLSYFQLLICRFLINMFYAFVDFENIYLVTDLVTGGDLRYHHNKKKRFTES